MKLDPETTRRILEQSGTTGALPPLPSPGTILTLFLPLPPSTNNLFASLGNRRVKTKAYKVWVAEALAAVNKHGHFVPSPVAVTFTVQGKVFQARDLDNMLKPSLDVLVTGEVIAGDSLKHVHSLSIHYSPDDGEPFLAVVVRHIGA